MARAKKLFGIMGFTVLLLVFSRSPAYANPVTLDTTGLDLSMNAIMFETLLLAFGRGPAHAPSSSPTRDPVKNTVPFSEDLTVTNLSNVLAKVTVSSSSPLSLTYTFDGWCLVGPGCTTLADATNTLASTGGHWIDLCYNASSPALTPGGTHPILPSPAAIKMTQTNKDCGGAGTFTDKVSLDTSAAHQSNASALTLGFPSPGNSSYFVNASLPCTGGFVSPGLLCNDFAVHVAFNSACSGWVSFNRPTADQAAPDNTGDSCN